MLKGLRESKGSKFYICFSSRSSAFFQLVSPLSASNIIASLWSHGILMSNLIFTVFRICLALKDLRRRFIFLMFFMEIQKFFHPDLSSSSLSCAYLDIYMASSSLTTDTGYQVTCQSSQFTSTSQLELVPLMLRWSVMSQNENNCTLSPS